jgi:hypothetical protein
MRVGVRIGPFWVSGGGSRQGRGRLGGPDAKVLFGLFLVVGSGIISIKVGAWIIWILAAACLLMVLVGWAARFKAWWVSYLRESEAKAQAKATPASPRNPRMHAPDRR